MSYSKKVDARMQQKHDIAENWKNSDFVPESGEVIVYDPDEYTSSPRFKVGDGVTKVKDLKFVSEFYFQDEQPEDAEDGAIWISPKDLASDEGLAPVADWNAERGDRRFIDNRPLYKESFSKAFVIDEIPTGQSYKADDKGYHFHGMSDIEIVLNNEKQFTYVEQLYPSIAKFKEAVLAMNLPENEIAIGFINGIAFYLSTTSFAVVCATSIKNDSGMAINLDVLAIFSDTESEYKGEEIVPGCYFFNSLDGLLHINNFNFNYQEIVRNEEYKEAFKDFHASNVYMLDFDVFMEQELTEELIAALWAEISKYKPGDVILVPQWLITILSGGGANGISR